MRQLYDTTKKLSEKYSKQKRPAMDKEGKPITEIEEQRNRRVAHFEELTNRPAPLSPPDIEVVHTDLSIDITAPMTGEIRMVISRMKSGKVKTASVAAAYAVVGLNIHKEKGKILKYNTENTNPITFDGKALNQHLNVFPTLYISKYSELFIEELPTSSSNSH
ncbi:unnamed protein product [Schistosoma margrebowiei]|uniref:Uncharacterized protein n=1 Tax=Schistosoma margrebowiei TaxID=48269 RepID=A0A183MM26_9TREM|nr:unnamed protein product [Schistosoma margrebowiei]